jgi:hypothetical protein
LYANRKQMSYVYIIDIIVDIQPTDVLVSIGDTTQFSCNFTGEQRVRREKVTWLKGIILGEKKRKFIYIFNRW